MNCILTFDYELFGSGKGDVFKHLIDPTDKILTILKKREVKATFFVEYLEVEKIISLAEQPQASHKEKLEASALKNQLLKMAKQGHDIQLHIHPQWFNATKHNNQWQLNFAWWRLSALPYSYDAATATPGRFDLLKEGKAYLERLIRPVLPNYQCIAFRAGGYNLGVDEITAQALEEAGLTIESSICPGFYANSSLSSYDYTPYKNITATPFHHYLDKPKKEYKVTEYPLITVQSSKLEKLSLSRLYTAIFNRKYKGIVYNSSEKESTKQPQGDNFKNNNFDVCLSSKKQINTFLSVIQQENVDDVVLIGHPKDYSFLSPLNTIILEMQVLGGQFTTFAQLNTEVADV